MKATRFRHLGRSKSRQSRHPMISRCPLLFLCERVASNDPKRKNTRRLDGLLRNHPLGAYSFAIRECLAWAARSQDRPCRTTVHDPDPTAPHPLSRKNTRPARGVGQTSDRMSYDLHELRIATNGAMQAACWPLRLTSSNKKLLETSASLLVTSALLVVTSS